MSAPLSSSAPRVLQNYYRLLSGGADAYGSGEELRPLLSRHLDFTGALAGHHLEATECFLQGVRGFIATVSQIDIVGEVHDQRGSAVLYDAHLPARSVRFAEFFTYGDGVIATLHLHYDGQDYLAKGGR